jgi:hypothetical protein
MSPSAASEQPVGRQCAPQLMRGVLEITVMLGRVQKKLVRTSPVRAVLIAEREV